MAIQYEVDIDSEKIRFEGEWLGCTELAEKIRRMIESQDFRIGTAGAALEYLQQALLNARTIQVRVAPADAQDIEAHAVRAGISVETLARQAILAYLAAQPVPAVGTVVQPAPAAVPAAPSLPVSLPTPMVSGITTEPVRPGEETAAVELTRQKDNTNRPTAKVLVDPSLQFHPGTGEAIEMSWFKK